MRTAPRRPRSTRMEADAQGAAGVPWSCPGRGSRRCALHARAPGPAREAPTRATARSRPRRRARATPLARAAKLSCEQGADDGERGRREELCPKTAEQDGVDALVGDPRIALREALMHVDEQGDRDRADSKRHEHPGKAPIG